MTNYPSFREITETLANRIYEILVNECGAYEGHRSYFCSFIIDGGTEYRFRGYLGFGGKLYVESRNVRISCYPEDRSAFRDTLINNAMLKLHELANGEGI